MIVYSKMIVITNVVTNNMMNVTIMTNNTTNIIIITNVVIIIIEINVLLPIKKRKVKNEILKINLESIL